MNLTNPFSFLILLIGAGIPMVRTLQLVSHPEPSLGEKIRVNFLSSEDVQWEIKSQNTTYLELKIDRIYVNAQLTYPGGHLSLSVYDGPCSERRRKLTQESQSFEPTSNGTLCVFYPATEGTKNVSIFVTVQTVYVVSLFQPKSGSYYTLCRCQPKVIVTGPGIINSIGYLNNTEYPPNLDCTLHLIIPKNKNLKISFASFEMESSTSCLFDSLSISRQILTGVTKIAQFCGSDKPDDIIVGGPDILFHFVSDQVMGFPGFQLSYELTEEEEANENDPSCPKQNIFNGNKPGIITSPGFENGNYPPNKNCQYIIKIPKNKIIKLTFQVFQLDGSDSCSDSLTIYQRTSSLHRIGKWCGNEIPKEIFSKGPEIVIQFESDEYFQGTGFRLHYQIMKQPLENCGTRHESFQANIFNGDDVESSLKWPWIVSLAKYGSPEHPHCAGLILNEYWILTAAHCVRKSPYFAEMVVLAGDVNRYDAIKFQIRETFSHPRNNFIFNQDIALIRLKTPLTMSDTVQPICLENSESFTNCYAAGWGTEKHGGYSVAELNEAKVQVWSKEDCKKRWSNMYKDHMICARGKGTTCRGDSGGPLMCSDKTGHHWSIIGVSTFATVCGHPKDVPVFTNVTASTSWIKQIMRNYPEDYPRCSLEYPSMCGPKNTQNDSNKVVGLPEFFCNFNNGTTCNYLFRGSEKLKVRTDPLDSTNSYLFISMESKRNYVQLLSPGFDSIGSTPKCLSFIYKLNNKGSYFVLSVNKLIPKKRRPVWMGKEAVQWQKGLLTLDDPSITKFYFGIAGQRGDEFSMDNISLTKGNCDPLK